MEDGKKHSACPPPSTHQNSGFMVAVDKTWSLGTSPLERQSFQTATINPIGFLEGERIAPLLFIFVFANAIA